MDRTKQPEFKKFEKIDFIETKKSNLQNGIEVYSINAGSEEVIKLDLLFEAGVWYQKAPLVASFTNALLREGSKNYSSAEISERLDFYGAYLHAYVEKDLACVSLYCQNKHFEKTIEIFADIIKNPLFVEEELNILLNKRREQFLVDSEKVKVIASKNFQQVLFGKSHPYGKHAGLEDFANFERKMLLEFYNDYYTSGNCKIIVSGFIEERILKLLDENLGRNEWNRKTLSYKNDILISTTPEQLHLFEKEDSVQSAIRVGKLLFNKTHPDIMGMHLLNMVLGGYFGSRLMTNIREDKGYTYGIGSFIVSLKHSGYFAISTETGSEYTSKTIEEIAREIKKLQKEKISSSELERVKNHFLGDLTRSFDGPFEMADSFKSLLEYNLDYNYINKLIEVIKSTSPNELLELANKYLNFDTMKIVVAGKLDSEINL